MRETRRAVTRVTFQELERLLQLPADVVIDAAQVEMHTNSILVRLEGGSLPPLRDGDAAPMLTAVMNRRERVDYEFDWSAISVGSSPPPGSGSNRGC